MPRRPSKTKKSVKGEMLTVRLTTKIKFGLDLMARKQQRSQSSIVIDALTYAMNTVDTGLLILRDSEDDNMGQQRVFILDEIWDPLEPDRIVKLATIAPELLSSEEEILWKLVKEESSYWERDKSPNFKKIRDNWDKISTEAKKLESQHS